MNKMLWRFFLMALLLSVLPRAVSRIRAEQKSVGPFFATADSCMACHNGLITPWGEDASIGIAWQATMMANSSRDPYWQAAVRREVTEHPKVQSDIEDECAACHMPMARLEARTAGRKQGIFGGSGSLRGDEYSERLGIDGVSCTLCHQITDANLGTRESFTAGFAIDTIRPLGQRNIFGPFEVDLGRTRIMQSASRFLPMRALHLQSSEACATCHTLFTHALNSKGEVVGEFPEQVPYMEWQHSDYGHIRSCQSCHMPYVGEKMPISSVLGEPRSGFFRHEFRGGNFFMLRILTRNAQKLAVQAPTQHIDSAALRTIRHLETDSARILVEDAKISEQRLDATILVENLAGHKLPTAYPSRRAWIRFILRDPAGKVIFESGKINQDGSIRGNENDRDPAHYEPHYGIIEREDQVQIYEAIMADHENSVTTGLLAAVRFLKDNRILPSGFDKKTANDHVAARGLAVEDADFSGGSDRIRYSIECGESKGSFTIQAELWYQPIGYRWARNLDRIDTKETAQFVTFYESMASFSAVILARTSFEVTSE